MESIRSNSVAGAESAYMNYLTLLSCPLGWAGASQSSMRNHGAQTSQCGSTDEATGNRDETIEQRGDHRAEIRPWGSKTRPGTAETRPCRVEMRPGGAGREDICEEYQKNWQGYGLREWQGGNPPHSPGGGMGPGNPGREVSEYSRPSGIHTSSGLKGGE